VFELLLKNIAAALDSRGIPYMIIGGQAVLRYGEVRLTKDIDLTIGLTPSEAQPLIETLESLEMTSLVDDPQDFLTKTFVLPVEHKESGLRIDFIFSLSEYERLAISRSVAFDVGGVPVRYITLEDLVIFKIVAGRPRDLEDVRSLLVKNRSTNKEEILRWLKEYDAELGEGFEIRFLEIVKSLPKST
jgi:predicted nucleotidyltransferase